MIFRNKHFILNTCLALESSDKFINGLDTQLRGSESYKDSCSVKIGYNILLFGGTLEPRQVSIVYSGGVSRLHSLDFDFIDGRCHYSYRTVYLCFSVASQAFSHKR